MAAKLRSVLYRIPCYSTSVLRCPSIVSQGFKTSSCSRGLEEFFPPGVLDKGELAPETVKTGRRWRAGELRTKSNEDLHKLWYVLLKERNMLNTLKHEANRQGVPMPSPERYHKVKKSMAVIKLVLGEREKALQDLESQVWEFDEQTEFDYNLNLETNIGEEKKPEIREVHSAPEPSVLRTSEDKTLNEQPKSKLHTENQGLSPNLLRPT
ncbi:39S ribosomal protein L47, mitochondrial-like [Actinia tenebrosa]|uniref:Large ribosomal subunit protein uL29m n=1 Tax=Actinia tenebrosa TaxID=6105 RepID=A0A6P8J5X8_ACTTE|nr:39S ribosomal protein L47, mitochondrial-like [Actinia tenebrosa]